MSHFRLGIVGTGMIAESAHLPAALATTRAEVTALVDPVVARATSLASRFGLSPRCVGSVSEILDAVDGIVIATPNHTHCPIALEAVARGVDCLVEKPLGVTTEECRRLVQGAKDGAATVAVAFSTRFFENVIFMGELLRRAHFGRVRRFFYQAGSFGGWAPLSGYNLDRSKTGGGVLVVTGTHFLDRMLAWFGYPEEIEYRDDSHGGPEANCWARFRFGDGLVGEIRLSKTVPLPAGIVLDTEAGTVLFGEGDVSEPTLRPHGRADLETVVRGRGAAWRTSAKDPFQRQLEDFIQGTLPGASPLIPAERGLESVRLVEEMYAARQPIETDTYRALAAAVQA